MTTHRIDAFEATFEHLSADELALELQGHLWDVSQELTEDLGSVRLSDEPGYQVTKRGVTLAGLRRLLAELRYLEALADDPDDSRLLRPCRERPRLRLVTS
jgi:hypothetical protein